VGSDLFSGEVIARHARSYEREKKMIFDPRHHLACCNTRPTLWIGRAAGRLAFNERILPSCDRQMEARENRDGNDPHRRSL
jgi:hypothetical protein